MGRLKQKGKSGAATNYITRNQAIKKLQISLADFRRLCILKGIYPREPRNKKKANKGSTAPTTFYYTKDIQYLLHEPVLRKFREYKTFARKLSKVLAKGQYSIAKRLEENKPIYTLDHIVKERYPAFTDALRDLDDALSMVFLFATMPVTDKIKPGTIESCQRLSAEFEYYVMYSRSLRKVFLSIKGIYYQADIKGQTITWMVPYQFSQMIPTDVDFRIMLTFLEFYQTLLGFVNYKLFSEVNLVYPPKLDAVKLEGAAGFNALVIKSINQNELAKRHSKSESEATEKDTIAEKTQRESSEKRLKTLFSKITQLDQEPGPVQEDNQIDSIPLDEFKIAAPVAADESTSASTITLHDLEARSIELSSLQNLFSQSVFYLSRETPRYVLEFVIRSFGGQVGWDPIVGDGSPFAENDSRITHHICDRPLQGQRFVTRSYMQPQWIFDCINARKLLKTKPYEPGQTLPPHLSPFVELKEGDYDPLGGNPELIQEMSEGQVDVIAPSKEVEEEKDEESDADVEDEDESDESISADENEHQRELEAEAAGISFSEYQGEKKNSKKVATKVAGNKRSVEEIEEEEVKEMSTIMMTKKQKNLYSKIQYGQKRKTEEVIKLKRKKEQLAESKKPKTRSSKQKQK